jgi:DNA-binding transcriptional ArsR family regulator
MKRDMDLVRELLLKLESNGNPPGTMVVIDPYHGRFQIDGYSADQIAYHLSLIREAGFIESPGSQRAGMGVTFRRLSWDGHDYLDAIRDPEIWRKTKGSAEAVGSFTFDLVKDLAKGFIRTKIEEHTGIKL